MSSRLCATCNLIFTGPQFRKQVLSHHQSRESIISAVGQGCYICGVVIKSDAWKSLNVDAPFQCTWYLEPLSGSLSGWFKLTIDCVETGEDSGEENDGSDEHAATMGPVETAQQTESESVEPRPPVPIWSFVMQPAKDVEGGIGHYTPPKESDHPEILELGQRWLSKCKAEHLTCNNQNPAFRPTRLLEIVSPTRARVVMTNDKISSLPYATLSHCWGKGKTLRLMTSNMNELQSGISIDDLPSSYREGISVCNKFGFRYIWIDSLCIIQDSLDDWRQEAMAMRDVYRNSMLNIAAAAAAENADSSFTARDASTIPPLPIETQWEGLEHRKYFLTNANAYRDEVAFSPLRRRAWVVQEVWLASHNLYLTKNQLWWKCCEIEASEAYPEGLPEELSSQGSLTGFGKQRYDVVGLHHSWNRLVETYSGCDLTVLSDKMMAFAGIAQHFQILLGSDDVYVAGLWYSQLPQALCWFSTKEDRAYRPSTYRAPSWSWASLEGAIRFDHNSPNAEKDSIRPLSSVVGCQASPVNQDSTGSLKGGSIEIYGSLTRIGFWNDRMSVEDSCGKFSLIPGVDTMAYSQREEHWTLVDDDETTHARWSYMDGLSSHDLKTGQMDKATRKTKLWIAGEEEHLIFSLPIMSWIEGGKPWMKGLILFRVDVEGIRTYQRIGRFTARGAIPIERLMQNTADTILIL
ncbi:heterokaryon incompatibility protein-domain-containing protein [Rhexocercosporidium sp. MPI-PUGE-AT-0058]|nr:heterokaryon incompatibility protein-domain-containing protein [Rhexocercosporidium sp. MPI-PUGE-AT-0058]